jgi:prepilin-type N-terminal cleavage/methylation domain-containing protein
MPYACAIHRSGMTLVELLVVIIILGLLGVAAAPAINSSSSKSRLREAASSVSSQITRAASQAVGRTAGFGAWFEPETSGTATSPTTMLRFCPGTVEASGTVRLEVSSLSAAQASIALMAPSYETLTETTTVPSGTLLRISGMPYDYTLINTGTVSFIGSSTVSSWPRPQGGTYPGTVEVPFTLQVPPMRTTGGKTVLGGNVCVDLPQSTVGVYSYSPTVTPISNNGPLIITFDNVGRPKTILFSGTNTNSPPTLTASNAQTPVALLVGLRDQVGASYQSSPTDDNPGTNWQRKDAWWVVIDPRSGSVFQVENCPNATNPEVAQKFIRQKLLNRNNAN